MNQNIFRTRNGIVRMRVPGHTRYYQDFGAICEEHHFVISDICDAFDLPLSVFRTEFLAHVGLSPKKWMIEYRVILAMRKLREGTPMTEIIDQLGYFDQPHLGKDFKALLGLPPRDLREKLLEMQTQVAPA